MGFGDELQEKHFGDIDHLVQNGIAYLVDMRDFVKERAALEKEYGDRLEKLAKTYGKRARKCNQSFFAAGTNFTASSLSSSAVATTAATPDPSAGGGGGGGGDENPATTSSRSWLSYLLEMEKVGRARMKFADEMISSVANDLKAEQKRVDDVRQKHAAFFAKLGANLDAMKKEMESARSSYHDAGRNVDSCFTKYEKVTEDKPTEKEKLGKEWNDATATKQEKQNEFLLTIDAYNSLKDKHYQSSIPVTFNHLQDLNQHVTARSRKILGEFIAMDTAVLLESKASNENALRFVDAIDPAWDSVYFVSQIRKDATSVPNAEFDPYTPEDLTVLDLGAGRAFFLNKMQLLQQDMDKLSGELEQKAKKIEGLVTLKGAYENNPTTGDPFIVHQEIIDLERDTIILDAQMLRDQVLVNNIQNAAGNVSINQHQFKPSTSGTCAVCNQGLSMFNRGHSCKECSVKCHEKCKMRLPPACGITDDPVPPVATTTLKPRGSLRVANKKKFGSVGKHFKVSDEFVAEEPEERQEEKEPPTAPAPAVGAVDDWGQELERELDRTAEKDRDATKEKRKGKEADKEKEKEKRKEPEREVKDKVKDNNNTKDKEKDKDKDKDKDKERKGKSNAVKRKSDKQSRTVIATGLALFDFQKSNDEELSMTAGAQVNIIELDSGQGWMTVEINSHVGFVPTDYVQVHLEQAPLPKENAAKEKEKDNSPKKGKKDYVRALYDYDATVDMELTIRAGDKIEITNRDIGDGWWEGKLKGKTGQFPANYVEPF